MLEERVQKLRIGVKSGGKFLNVCCPHQHCCLVTVLVFLNFSPVTIFCPSVPPRDSLLCCPQAPNKGRMIQAGGGIIRLWVEDGGGVGISHFTFMKFMIKSLEDVSSAFLLYQIKQMGGLVVCIEHFREAGFIHLFTETTLQEKINDYTAGFCLMATEKRSKVSYLLHPKEY